MTRAANLGWATTTVVASVAYLVLGLIPKVPHLLRSVSDDVLHASAYVLLAFLAAMWLAASRPRLAVALGAGYAFLHGALLEVLQYFNPPRAAELSDLAADAVGALLGALAAAVLLWRRR